MKKVNILLFSKYSIYNNDNDLKTFNKNLLYKKLDQRYLNKLSFLLSYNDKKYVQKRNNINELEYKIDKNNNLYLTNSFYSNQNNIRENKKKCFSQKINVLKINNPNSKKIQDLIPEFKSKEIQFNESFNNNLSYDRYYYLNKTPIEKEDEKKIMFSFIKNLKGGINKLSYSQNSFNIVNIENSFQVNKNSSNNTLLNENSLCKTSRKNYYNDRYSLKNNSMIENVHNLSTKYKLIREHKNKKKKMDFINLFSYNKTKYKNNNNKNSIFKFRNIKMNNYQSKIGFLPNLFLKYDNSIEHNKNQKNLSVDDINNKLINNNNKNIKKLEKSKEKFWSKEEIFEKIKLGSKYLEWLVKNTKKLINEKIIKKEDNTNNKNLKYKSFHKSFSLISKKKI